MNRLSTVLAYFIPMVTLWFMSFLILNSVSADSARTQVFALLISVSLFYLVSRVDYQLYLFSPWPWYVIANLLLLSTYILGSVTRGSIRWITILGTSLQTSEMAKPLLILFIAAYLSRHLPQTLKQVSLFCLLMMVPTILVYLQPDLGSAILIVIITATSLVAAGVSFKKLALIGLILICLTPVIYLNLKDYQRNRLLSFVSPNVDPLGTGYNALQATIAVGSGKLFGRGIGQGTQSHLRFLPERQTDFVFASLVEELGLFGGLIILGSYFWLAYTLLQTAKRSSTTIGSIICLVTLTLLISQGLINMGMNMGIMPVTGITLPLVSAGGSSLFSFMILLGICFSIARHPSSVKPSLEIR